MSSFCAFSPGSFERSTKLNGSSNILNKQNNRFYSCFQCTTAWCFGLRSCYWPKPLRGQEYPQQRRYLAFLAALPLFLVRYALLNIEFIFTSCSQSKETTTLTCMPRYYCLYCAISFVDTAVFSSRLPRQKTYVAGDR